MARQVPPLSIREQFGFVWRLLPLVSLGIVILLFRVWKVLETDQLRNHVFNATRVCASLEGELQIEEGVHLAQTAFGRIEKAGRELGLAWPDSNVTQVVVDPRLMRPDADLEWLDRSKESAR